MKSFLSFHKLNCILIQLPGFSRYKYYSRPPELSEKKIFFYSILCPPIAKPHLREASTIQTKKGGLYINPEGLIYIAFLVIYYSIHYHYASKRYGVSVIKRKRKEETLTKQKPHNKYYH